MHDLINEFRNWDQKWWKYDYQGGPKPPSIDEFIKELSKTYKVIKIENNE